MAERPFADMTTPDLEKVVKFYDAMYQLNDAQIEAWFAAKRELRLRELVIIGAPRIREEDHV